MASPSRLRNSRLQTAMANAVFNQVCDSVQLTLTANQPKGWVFHSLQTADARLRFTVTLGEVPSKVHYGEPKLYNLTGPVHALGGAILCFVGPPNKSVDWRLISGDAILTPYTTATDPLGRASCRLDAVGITGRVIVGVAYVP